MTDYTRTLAISRDGQIFAWADQEGTIPIWSVETWKLIRTLSWDTDFINAIGFGGTILAADATVQIEILSTDIARHPLLPSVVRPCGTWMA